MGFSVTKTIQLLGYQPLGNLPFAGGDAISDIAAAASLWQRHRLLRLGYWEMFMKNGGFQCKNIGKSTKYGGFVSWEIRYRSKWEEIFQQTRSQLAAQMVFRLEAYCFWSTSNSTGFPKSWGYPKNHQFCSWDFPWNKPSSYWGNSIYGTPTCLPECWGCHSRNNQGCDHAQFWPRAISAAPWLAAGHLLNKKSQLTRQARSIFLYDNNIWLEKGNMLINHNMIIPYDILIIYNCSSTWMESWHITSFGNQTWQWTMIDYQRVYSHQNYISLHIPLHHIRITLYIYTQYIYIDTHYIPIYQSIPFVVLIQWPTFSMAFVCCSAGFRRQASSEEDKAETWYDEDCFSGPAMAAMGQGFWDSETSAEYISQKHIYI